MTILVGSTHRERASNKVLSHHGIDVDFYPCFIQENHIPHGLDVLLISFVERAAHAAGNHI